MNGISFPPHPYIRQSIMFYQQIQAAELNHPHIANANCHALDCTLNNLKCSCGLWTAQMLPTMLPDRSGRSRTNSDDISMTESPPRFPKTCFTQQGLFYERFNNHMNSY
jgi:hypothetical protein